jgi:hypothetical protein
MEESHVYKKEKATRKIVEKTPSIRKGKYSKITEKKNSRKKRKKK